MKIGFKESAYIVLLLSMLLPACAKQSIVVDIIQPPDQIVIVDVMDSAYYQSTKTVFNLNVSKIDGSSLLDEIWHRYAPVFEYEDWVNDGSHETYREISIIYRGANIALRSCYPNNHKNQRDSSKSSYHSAKMNAPSHVARQKAFNAIVRLCLKHKHGGSRESLLTSAIK